MRRTKADTWFEEGMVAVELHEKIDGQENFARWTSTCLQCQGILIHAKFIRILDVTPSVRRQNLDLNLWHGEVFFFGAAPSAMSVSQSSTYRVVGGDNREAAIPKRP